MRRGTGRGRNKENAFWQSYSDIMASLLMVFILIMTGAILQIMLKYEGYLARQRKQVEEFRKEESRLLPRDLDYSAIAGLRLEAREKLSQIRPMSIGQAGRISGVSPADIAVLLIWLEQNGGARIG